jgi:hypothetical protein
MSTVRRPRVYTEEVPSASKPIEGRTSIAAFVRFAGSGLRSRRKPERLRAGLGRPSAHRCATSNARSSGIDG